MSLEQILFIFITTICWSLAVWLFWKWNIGCYRSEFEQRLKKEKKQDANKNRRRA
jgi:hypothetical protein